MITKPRSDAAPCGGSGQDVPVHTMPMSRRDPRRPQAPSSLDLLGSIGSGPPTSPLRARLRTRCPSRLQSPEVISQAQVPPPLFEAGPHQCPLVPLELASAGIFTNMHLYVVLHLKYLGGYSVNFSLEAPEQDCVCLFLTIAGAQPRPGWGGWGGCAGHVFAAGLNEFLDERETETQRTLRKVVFPGASMARVGRPGGW